MTKLPRFPAFDVNACLGDSVHVTIGDVVAVATIWEEDNKESPEERDCAFWPSLDPRAPGYLGDGKGLRSLAVARANAHRILKAWKNDKWEYVGIALQYFVRTDDGGLVAITGLYDHAIWGVEMNYPGGRKAQRNSYLRTVAGDLLAESFEVAQLARFKVKPLVIEGELARDQLPKGCVHDIVAADPFTRPDMAMHWRDELRMVVDRPRAIRFLVDHCGFGPGISTAMAEASDATIAAQVLLHAANAFALGEAVVRLP